MADLARIASTAQGWSKGVNATGKMVNSIGTTSATLATDMAVSQAMYGVVGSIIGWGHNAWDEYNQKAGQYFVDRTRELLKDGGWEGQYYRNLSKNYDKILLNWAENHPDKKTALAQIAKEMDSLYTVPDPTLMARLVVAVSAFFIATATIYPILHYTLKSNLSTPSARTSTATAVAQIAGGA